MFLALLEDGGGVDCMVTTGGFTCTSGVPLSSVDVAKCTRGICLMTLEMPSYSLWPILLRLTVIALLISSSDTPCCARWRRSSGVPALAFHSFFSSFPPKFRTVTTSLSLCFPLSPAENLLSVLANLGAGAGRGVLLATVLLLSSVTSCTSRLLPGWLM